MGHVIAGLVVTGLALWFRFHEGVGPGTVWTVWFIIMMIISGDQDRANGIGGDIDGFPEP